ncbi:MAG: phospholipid carrier-dependent glycosyltransferase [Candidatus Omnitrophica bacterium]|nr:phospholipid carrier-dependent glycosyltransferase [Candidatus Omnitrophota bacterium]
MKKNLPVVFLLATFVIIVFTSVNTKSPICDEAGHHIAAGYSFLKTGDFRMNPATPPLTRMLMAAPLLPLNLKLPLNHPSWQNIDSTVFNYQFLYVLNQNPQRIIFLSRLPMIALSALLGILIFIWAQKIYGYKAGLFALFLYVFSPTVLANAGLGMADMGSAFFMSLAIYQYWKFNSATRRRTMYLLLTGICSGLAFSAKINAFLLLPLFFIWALYRVFLAQNRKQELHRQTILLLIIFAISFITLWATYGFEFKPLLKNAPDIPEKIAYINKLSKMLPFVNQEETAHRLVDFAQNTPIPLSAYIISCLGIINQVVRGEQAVFFFGNSYLQGSKIYYFIVFLIKTPLPFLVLIAISLLLLILKKRTPVDKLTNSFISLPIIFFFLSASFSKLQGGLRYLLPMYPFLLIWLSDIVNVRLKNKKIYAPAFFTAISIWYAACAFLTYPNYLAYFNELVGGMNGFGYKITHDLDWGQDLPALSEYLRKEKIETVRLLYFGTAEPAAYGITYTALSSQDYLMPGKNVYAISARYLRVLPWTANATPTAKPGYSIFVYDFRNS